MSNIFKNWTQKIRGFVFKYIKKLPAIQRRIEKEYAEIMEKLESSLKPYKNKFTRHTELPQDGIAQKQILDMMTAMKQEEESRWKNGFASGAVYHGDDAHINFLNKVYALHSQSNPLHADLWPSASKYEAEIVAMTSRMLHGDHVGGDTGSGVCGVVTSGGTESIMLAMKTYRDMARDKKGIRRPEMVVPETAHAAFDKAAQYFGIKLVKAKIDPDFKVDIKDVKKKINANTIVIAGSAPSFPHGIIDPIEELSYVAKERDIPFHTDACLGGFLLPWIEKLDYDVPSFDFRLPGVTSISVDTHKYGYAAKGTSVILYRNPEIRHYQFYKATDWPGGLYFSPTFAGSRPGALSAAAWAAMLKMGQSGYLEAARRIMDAATIIKQGIAQIPELFILGEPLWNIAFASDKINIYRVMEKMGEYGWSLNGLHKPEAVHICLTLRQAQPQVPENFIKNLQESVDFVKANPHDKGEIAPVYGMAATMPDRDMVEDLLDLYMDALYKP